jgi:2-polyprenyl-6-methoxyphenol hydroxylase-like FAD-dependent oxidoreductase
VRAAIAGAGVAGLVAARQLGLARLTVDVYERSPEPSPPWTMCRRVSCVHCSLRSLRLALVAAAFRFSPTDEKQACLPAHSSRTAARQPGSARRRAIRVWHICWRCRPTRVAR